MPQLCMKFDCKPVLTLRVPVLQTSFHMQALRAPLTSKTPGVEWSLDHWGGRIVSRQGSMSIGSPFLSTLAQRVGSVMIDSTTFGLNKIGMQLDARKVMIFYTPIHLHLPKEVAEASGLLGTIKNDILRCTQPQERQYTPPIDVTGIAKCIAQPAAAAFIRRSVYVGALSVNYPRENAKDADTGFSFLCSPVGGLLVEHVDIRVFRFGQEYGEIKLMILVLSLSPVVQG